MRPGRLVPALLAAALLSAPAIAQAAPAPAIAAARIGHTDVLSADGKLVRRFGSMYPYSLYGRLLVGMSGVTDVVGRDAVTGERRFRIRNAYAPVALAGGRVVFLADLSGNRDPQVNSVWLRTPDGKTRKLVQFSNGAGLPGVDTGFDNSIQLGLSADAAGRRLAVTQGNDVDMFEYDIWVVDTRTRSRFRATTDGRSRLASISPDGQRLAYLREEALCGGPEPGYRAGDLMVRDARRGATAAVLLDGSCSTFYTEPHWLSNGVLVANRLTSTGPGAYDSAIVRIPVSSGAATVIAGGENGFGLSVSPALRLLAFTRNDGYSTVIDLRTGSVRTLPGTFSPRVSRDGAWS